MENIPRILENELMRIAPDVLSDERLTIPSAGSEGAPHLKIVIAEKWIEEILKKKNSESGPDQDFVFSRELLTKQFKMPGVLIDRLFRALLVYSFGIYDMLKSVFKHQVNGSKTVNDFWLVFVSQMEAADPELYDEAIRAIGEQEIRSKEEQQKDLMERESQLRKQEASLEMRARLLEERIEALEENNATTMNLVAEEDDALALQCRAEQLADTKLQLEMEKIEWIKTIDYYESSGETLSETSQKNIGQ